MLSPDYLFSGTGMRIDGVSEDRPAANAGMKKGDIVVRMGDHEVNDMMGYMEGLAMFEEGPGHPCGDCAEWREPGPRRHVGLSIFRNSRCSTALALGPVRKVRTA